MLAASELVADGPQPPTTSFYPAGISSIIRLILQRIALKGWTTDADLSAE